MGNKSSPIPAGRGPRLTALLFPLLLPALLLASDAEDRPLECRPGPDGLPAVRVLLDGRLAPVMEALGARLRDLRLVDVQVWTMDVDELVRRAADPESGADAVMVEGRDAVDLLSRAGGVREEDAAPLAAEELMIAVRAEDWPLDPLKALRGAGTGRAAAPDPKTVQAGVHAQAALRKIGIFDEVAPRLRYYATARAAAESLRSKETDVAILYRSDVADSPDLREGMVFPRPSRLPILIYGAALPGGRERGLAFLRLLRSPDAVRLWERFGFSAP